MVDAWGAGGAGFDGGNNGGGAGGGGGAFASSTISVTPGENITLVVGLGGDTSQDAGTDSTFDGNVVVADAGLGGTDPTTAAGAGGTIADSTGTLENAGGNGGAGRNGSGQGATDEGGGGGGAGGPHGDGAVGADAVDGDGGDGGSGDAGSGGAGGALPGEDGTADTNGGGGGAGANEGGVGGTGGAPGAGGGGGEGGQGNGADGRIVLTELVDDAGCVSIEAPTVTTDFAGFQATSANLVGSITVTGGEDASQTGFAYGTDLTLATVIATTTLGPFTGTGPFNEVIGGLSATTPYYFRAYATNDTGGTGFGSIESFTTGNATPSRKMRLFEGFRIKFISGTMKLLQQ